MYYEKPIPFYLTYPYKDMYNREKVLDFDMQRMKSYYPRTSSKIQRCIEDTCDRMEYEGSFMYDEYPDRLTMNRMCDHICGQVKKQEMSLNMAEREVLEELEGQSLKSQEISDFALRELVQVLFSNEVYHRRSRRCRCRRYF